MKKIIPKVSILVPVYNENVEILTQSLKSIASQTFREFECIIVDDSTNWATINACKSFCNSDNRFKYIKPPHRLGLAASLNKALAESSGDLIARFDADDICMPDRISRQFDFLTSHSDVDVLGTGMRIIDEGGKVLHRRIYPSTHKLIDRKFIFTTAIAHPTVMVRRSVLLSAGGYDESFKFAEDLELWLRLLNIGAKFYNLADELILYRQSKTSRSINNWHSNIRARIKNLSFRFFPLNILSIIGILIWSLLPKFLQELIYKALMLKIA
jgi:glycosyltransferase involved in cell wall biosynthesis